MNEEELFIFILSGICEEKKGRNIKILLNTEKLFHSSVMRLCISRRLPQKTAARRLRFCFGFDSSEGADYSWGPAATRALPASLPVYLTKFLMKRPARSSALAFHTATSA